MAHLRERSDLLLMPSRLTTELTMALLYRCQYILLCQFTTILHLLLLWLL